MKLLLVDDHALFREGLELVLRHLDAAIEVVQAADVTQALHMLEGAPGIDMVLLDLHMPGMRGLDALHALRKGDDKQPVVVLSGSEDMQVVWQAIDAGAMGFIQKQSDSRTMMAALRIVLEGGVYLPAACLTQSGRRGGELNGEASARDRWARLGISERQAQVLVSLAKGRSNKLIARELGISEATVKSHVSAVFMALDVHSRTEAVYAIARLGLRLHETEA